MGVGEGGWPTPQTAPNQSSAAVLQNLRHDAALVATVLGNRGNKHGRFSDRVPNARASGGGGHDEYDGMVRAALQLARSEPADARARTLGLLYDLFPTWFVPAFRGFLALWPMW